SVDPHRHARTRESRARPPDLGDRADGLAAEDGARPARRTSPSRMWSSVPQIVAVSTPRMASVGSWVRRSIGPPTMPCRPQGESEPGSNPGSKLSETQIDSDH